MDETGISKFDHMRMAVVSKHRSHHNPPRVMGTDWRGHITAVVCISADGRVAPCCFITAAKEVERLATMLKNAHETTVLLSSGTTPCSLARTRSLSSLHSLRCWPGVAKGWIDKESFRQWLKEVFIPWSGASPDNRVMLIVDNHSSRYNPEMWVDAWEAGVLLQALPPHCTPFMQPLDFGCFGPYKNDVDEYAMQCRVKGHDIGDWNVITILEHGLRSVFTVRRIVAAWLYTGLYPLKRSRIPEHLLSPPAAAFAAAAAADAAGDGSAAAAALRMPNMPDLLRLAMEARPELKEIVHDQSKLRVALEAMKQKRKRKKRAMTMCTCRR